MNDEQLSINEGPVTTAVPDTYLQAALTAYENARADGLCHDGAWECAVTALRASPSSVDVAQLSAELQKLQQEWQHV